MLIRCVSISWLSVNKLAPQSVVSSEGGNTGNVTHGANEKLSISLRYEKKGETKPVRSRSSGNVRINLGNWKHTVLIHLKQVLLVFVLSRGQS